jgi:pimeloyl-ACP methyl ester carboxylesterase
LRALNKETAMAGPGKLNVWVAGDEEPTLVFVHGFGCSLEDWKAQLEALSARFRCVALDLPGHGGSEMPVEPTMVALGTAVNVAKRQSGARQVILVGHSLGCKVIREAYWQSSSDVVGIVLIEGAFYEGERSTLVRRAQEAIDRAGFLAYAEQHFDAMFVGNSDPALREHTLARVRTLDPEFGRKLYLEAVGWDPVRGKETLRRLEVPVLVIQSTHLDSQFRRMPLTQATPTPFMDAVASLCAQSEAKVITGCGHFPMMEAADTVNQYLREFALSVPKPPDRGARA